MAKVKEFSLLCVCTMFIHFDLDDTTPCTGMCYAPYAKNKPTSYVICTNCGALHYTSYYDDHWQANIVADNVVGLGPLEET